MEEGSALLSLESLTEIRERTNQEARSFIRHHITAAAQTAQEDKTSIGLFPIMPVQSYACLYSRNDKNQITQEAHDSLNTKRDSDVDVDVACELDFLISTEEQALIRFYSSKFFSLVGPNAQLSRLQKDVKVASTAALLFRKFFLVNSVLMYDPKAIMVAAVFLGSKVEDATVDVRVFMHVKSFHSNPCLKMH